MLPLSIHHSADDFPDIKPPIESRDPDCFFRISYPPPQRSYISETPLICSPQSADPPMGRASPQAFRLRPMQEACLRSVLPLSLAGRLNPPA